MTGATIRCLSHSANPAIKSGAAGWIPTSMSLLTGQVPLYVGHSSKSGAGTANRTRVTCLPCTGSATELCQRSWRGDSNADHGLTRPALFPLSYTSTKLLEAAGRIALPMICFAGRRLAVLATPPQTLERSTGIAPVLPDWRSGVLLLYELRLERAARVELASSAWKAEAPAAIPCSLQQTWRSQRELNPSFLIDSQASCR